MGKKRWIAGMLALCMCLIPARAAEAKTSFSDVPEGSWFEHGMALCAERGIMRGTGEGLFSPDEELTGAECLTLILRLYDILQRGGNGDFLSAPEAWGKLTLTTEDGTAYTNHGPSAQEFSLPTRTNMVRPSHDILVMLPDTPENMERWGSAAAEEPATLTLEDGETISGTVSAVITYQGPWVAFFAEKPLPENWSEWTAAVYHPTPAMWWRDAVYTGKQWDVVHGENLNISILMSSGFTEPVIRRTFAEVLAEAVGDLPVLQTEVTIPDIDGAAATDDMIVALYQAGIFNGVDETGTFAPTEHLTRAEAATMIARVLDPSLRIGAEK